MFTYGNTKVQHFEYKMHLHATEQVTIDMQFL